MAKRAKVAEEFVCRPSSAMTPEGQEDEMIALAFQRARERLENGTASSSEIVHFLKLGSLREREERKKLQEEIKLLTAKTESIKADKERDVLYAQAIEAMRRYTPHGPEDI